MKRKRCRHTDPKTKKKKKTGKEAGTHWGLMSDAKNALIVAIKLGFFPFEDFFDFFDDVLPFDNCAGNRKSTMGETTTLPVLTMSR